MLIVQTDEGSSWNEFSELFSRIEQIALESDIVHYLNVTISDDVLTVSFHVRDTMDIPESVRKACEQILQIVGSTE